LSMKALRLYERQGLLVPDAVDSSNGYRWYRESQLEPVVDLGVR
jgi:DNA-binding transcriptional MerR regulator